MPTEGDATEIVAGPASTHDNNDQQFNLLLQKLEQWRIARDNGKRENKIELQRIYWETTVELLLAITNHKPAVRAIGTSCMYAIHDAADAISSALAGKPPNSWKGQKKGYSEVERRYIGYIVLYVELSRIKIIPDNQPVTTIKNVFGITNGIWRTWKNFPSADLNLEDYQAWLRHAGESAWPAYWLPIFRQVAQALGRPCAEGGTLLQADM